MRLKSASKANIFILEMTIVILIFALASAIAVGLFADARKVAQTAGDTTIAMMKTQSVAENFKSQDTFIDFTDLSGIKPWPLYFDKDWQAIPGFQNTSVPDNAIFTIEAKVSSEKTTTGLMAKVHLTASKILGSNGPLFEIQIQKYYPKQEGGIQ